MCDTRPTPTPFARCLITRSAPLRSEVLIGSLLPDEAKSEPCWAAWLLHSKYLSILTQHTISRAELITLGELIEEHQRAIVQVELPN